LRLQDKIQPSSLFLTIRFYFSKIVLLYTYNLYLVLYIYIYILVLISYKNIQIYQLEDMNKVIQNLKNKK